MALFFTYGNLSEIDVLNFLKETDAEHPVPLSARIDLETYARKLSSFSDFALCYLDDTIVGMISCYTNHPPLGYISNICVRKDFQHKGLFSQMFQLLTDNVRDKGVEYLRLEVDENNDRAKCVYDHIGFRRIGGDSSRGKLLLEMPLV